MGKKEIVRKARRFQYSNKIREKKKKKKKKRKEVKEIIEDRRREWSMARIAERQIKR